jgi:hypothetical protein
MTTDGLAIRGRIERKTYAVSDAVAASDSNWDDISRQSKLDVVDDIEPLSSETVYNVTTDRFHEYIVDNLDPDQTGTKDNVDASYFALGTDGGSGTSTTDTDLNNRVYSEPVTDHADNSTELLATAFIDSTEANGHVVDELGLYSGDPANLANAEVFLLNHATFSSITKDNSRVITFEVTLQFVDA